jgi:hypothetical protein
MCISSRFHSDTIYVTDREEEDHRSVLAIHLARAKDVVVSHGGDADCDLDPPEAAMSRRRGMKPLGMWGCRFTGVSGGRV